MRTCLSKMEDLLASLAMMLPAPARECRPHSRASADSGLRNGTGYYYRIAVSYVAADGQHRRSAGVVVKAVPEPVPRPVDDLDITGPGDGTQVLLAIWTPPPYGQVLLVRSDERRWDPTAYAR